MTQSTAPLLLDIVDLHAGGDVSRVILGGIAPPPGASLAEQARYLEHHADGLRRLLLSEPHGHPAMSVDLIVPAIHHTASAGYIIMEAMGYPAFSGSNTVCTATALLESGRIPMQEGEQILTLEAPAGPVPIVAECHNGRVTSITFEGSPAFVAERDVAVTLPDGRMLHVDLVFGGVYFAVVHAESLDLALVPEDEATLAALGTDLVNALRPTVDTTHPELGDTGPLSFVHFAGPVETVDEHHLRTRSVTYTHPGVICRSPTGTGTAARLAMLEAEGRLDRGITLQTVSLRGAMFQGNLVSHTHVGPHPALRPLVTARAWTIARSTLVLDPEDPLLDTSDLLAAAPPVHTP